MRNSDNREIYRIETVWQSREALDEMRRMTQTPKAIGLFKKIGVTPRLGIYEVMHNLP